MPSPSLLPSVTCNITLPPLPEHQRPLLICLSLFKDGRSVTQKRGGEEVKEGVGSGVRTMQSRASVAKVGGLRWGVSTARMHWCMNAVKSNASPDRQEGVGKVKAVYRGRAAVYWHHGATIPPSRPPSLFPSCLCFCCCCCCVPFIYLFPCISSSWALCCCFVFGATEEATALTRHSGHKEGATEIKRWRGNTATQKVLAYPSGIPTKLIPNEPNPSFPPSWLLLPPTSFLSPRPLPKCHSILFINMCKSLFSSTRQTADDTAEWHQRANVAPQLQFIGWGSILQVMIELELRRWGWERVGEIRKRGDGKTGVKSVSLWVGSQLKSVRMDVDSLSWNAASPKRTQILIPFIYFKINGVKAYR